MFNLANLTIGLTGSGKVGSATGESSSKERACSMEESKPFVSGRAGKDTASCFHIVAVAMFSSALKN